jgi:hypothetical protein
MIRKRSDSCVICGKGPHHPSRDGEYFGKKDIPCVCGEAHVVCFHCWTDPENGVLADSFPGWNAKEVAFSLCPKDVKVARRMLE